MVHAVNKSSTGTHAAQQKRRELRDVEVDYRLISDCVAGQRAIKARADVYLPIPNPDDTSVSNSTRYDAYLLRAMFYNVTQLTLSGLVGEVFSRDPVVEIPTGLDVVLEDGDGGGLTLTQLAKRATRYTLAKGRAGVLADYPQVAGGVSRADVERGGIQPTITIYDASSVINWREQKKAARTYYTLIVLVELYDDEDDGFIVHRKTQFRVLRLTDGVYTSEVFRAGSSVGGVVTPLDSDGKPFDAIPFTFIGSENNDADVDHPPMLDLANVNIAHYRNSADYEEAVYMVGQPTPVFSGLTEAWVKEVMNGQVRLGSRGGVMLPQGGDAKLLQMEANAPAFEAMTHKEKQMVALGAKLVENKEVQRTATDASIANNSETSVLSDVAKNVSTAITFALTMCARFTGDDPSDIKYELNTDFTIARMSSQDRQQLVAEWQTGAVSFSEMRAALRKVGVATLEDDAARTEIDEDDPIGGEDTGGASRTEDDKDDKDDPNANPEE